MLRRNPNFSGESVTFITEAQDPSQCSQFYSGILGLLKKNKQDIPAPLSRLCSEASSTPYRGRYRFGVYSRTAETWNSRVGNVTSGDGWLDWDTPGQKSTPVEDHWGSQSMGKSVGDDWEDAASAQQSVEPITTSSAPNKIDKIHDPWKNNDSRPRHISKSLSSEMYAAETPGELKVSHNDSNNT